MSKKINVVCAGCNKLFVRQKGNVEINIKRNGEYLCLSCSSYKRNSNPEYIAKLKAYCGEKHWAYGLPKEKNPNYGKKRSPITGKNISKALKKIDKNGLTIAQNVAKKASITMRNKGIYESNVKKSAITKTLNNTWVSYSTKLYNGLYYRSGLELDFIKKCSNNNISISNCNFIFEYTYLNKKRKYIPDFYCEETNTIYEIKSEYTLGLSNNTIFNVNLLKFMSACTSHPNFIIVLYKSNNKGVLVIKKHRYDDPIYYNYKELIYTYENTNI